jgi:hypothetical protein
MESSSDGCGVWPASGGAGRDRPLPGTRSCGVAGRVGAAVSLLGIAVAVVAAGCGGADKVATGPGTGGNPGPGSSDTVLSRVSGDSQTATMGTRLANPLVVRVADAKGTPMTGVTVNWAVAAGSGSIPATSATNASGQASAQWTLDNTYMGDSATASVAGHRVAFAAFGNGSGDLGGRQLFPADNAWNADVSAQPVDANSATYIASCGASSPLHPDFGTVYAGAPNGIPYVVVHGTQPRVPVSFLYATESDPGPYPVPPYAPIEGGASSSGDRHVLTLDADAWQVYEMWAAYPVSGGSSWSAGSGAIFDLTSDGLRPAGWTSADAAGLPILPGLVRYDEVVIHHAITHALRFTCPSTQNGYVAPARHEAGSANTALPPMGMRVRLKTSVNISGYSANLQVILLALQHYGMFVADNGSAFYLSGAPDPRWSDDELHGLTALHGSDFEVVQMGAISH